MSHDSAKPNAPSWGRVARIGKRIGQRSWRVLRDRLSGPSDPAPEGPTTVVFERAAEPGSAQQFEVTSGMTLLAVAAQSGIELPHYCGGQCSCGTCRVEVLEGAEHLSQQESMEQMVLGTVHVGAGDRLACQARVRGPVRIRVPRWF